MINYQIENYSNQLKLNVFIGYNITSHANYLCDHKGQFESNSIPKHSEATYVCSWLNIMLMKLQYNQ